MRKKEAIERIKDHIAIHRMREQRAVQCQLILKEFLKWLHKKEEH